MASYDLAALAANALRHLTMAERHGEANELPDAAERLGDAIDEGVKWYVASHEPQLREPTRGVHQWRNKILSDHAATIESSAEAVQTKSDGYPHWLGAEETNPIAGARMRVAAAKPPLGEKWIAVRAAAELVRRRLQEFGADREAARYVDLGAGRGPADIGLEQVQLALAWVRRVFRKWGLPGA